MSAPESRKQPFRFGDENVSRERAWVAVSVRETRAVK